GESGGTHTVSRCEGVDPIEIQPLRVVSRPDGLRGVIYDANVWFPKGSSIPGAIAAVLNLPKGFHPNYEALALYFEDPTSLDAIEHALKLVRLG
ncbi:MAG: hypothetical protein ACRDKS_07355, partial [Actinomycetota bacterium]